MLSTDVTHRGSQRPSADACTPKPAARQPLSTQTLSAGLYALADEIRHEEGCTTVPPHQVEEAAYRLDCQTIEIMCLRALVQRIAVLNPDAERIGAGMLAALVSDARRLLGQGDAPNVDAATAQIQRAIKRLEGGAA